MKSNLVIVKGSMIEGLTFKMSYILSLVGNLLYVLTIFFVWRSIYSYSTKEVINGLTFQQTVVYLVLAVAISNCIEVQVVWEMDNTFRTGKIITDLVKPVSFLRYLFCVMLGRRIDYFIAVFIPVFFCVYLITDGVIHFGLNLVLFLLSFSLAIMISYLFDFIVGLIVCYTHSTWGINTFKTVLVSFLSGAVLPLKFYPLFMKHIIDVLPFRAVYDIPIQTLLSGDDNIYGWLRLFGFQVLWCFVLEITAKLFWKRAKKAIVINGG